MIDKSLFSLPGIKKILVSLMGFALLEAAAVFGIAWSLSSAITGLWYGNALQEQLPWIALFLLCFVGMQVERYFQDLLLDRYAFSQADTLRQSLMRAIFSVGSGIVQESGTGNTTALLLEGVEQVETYLRLVLKKMIHLAVIPLLLLIPIFVLDWISGIIVLVIFPFIILYLVILGRMAKERAAKQHRVFQLLSNHFIDTLRGIDTLKLFGVSDQQGRGIYQVSEKFRKATIKTLSVATLSSAVLDLFATFSVAAVAIMLGLRLLEGSIVLFPALTVLLLAPEYFKPLREFAADFHASLDGRNALASLQAMIESGKKDAAPSYAEANNTDAKEVLSLPSWNEDSVFAANRLSFSYDGFEALRAISFAVSGFAKVGIIGASGAGKSTFIHLLGGFNEASQGSVCINGQTFASLRQANWQEHVAYLPQNPYIFHATLRENITFYHPAATEAEIARAIEMVGLDALVAELPEGLDTRIGEGARALSGGQAQRVALARACLDSKRSILLFDEPTAHLDIETELELKQRMLPLMQDKLVFFATHRLHWMQDMDLILVMEKGSIIASGTFEELRAHSSEFASLVSELRGGAA